MQNSENNNTVETSTSDTTLQFELSEINANLRHYSSLRFAIVPFAMAIMGALAKTALDANTSYFAGILISLVGLFFSGVVEKTISRIEVLLEKFTERGKEIDGQLKTRILLSRENSDGDTALAGGRNSIVSVNHLFQVLRSGGPITNLHLFLRFLSLIWWAIVFANVLALDLL